MPRSYITNQFIKAMLNNRENILVAIDEEGDRESCNGFKKACAAIDSVDEITFEVINKYTGFNYGWFMVIPSLDDDEQIADYCQYKGSDFINRRWNNLMGRV